MPLRILREALTAGNIADPERPAQNLPAAPKNNSAPAPYSTTPDGTERSRMTHRTGLSRGVLLLALLCAASFGAIVRVALAVDNYHVTCVEHGFYGGASTTDGSFFSRVDSGCSTTYKL